jgi:META domain
VLVATGDTDAVPPSRTVTLNVAEETASGSGPCNQFRLPFSVDGDELTTGPIAATKVACAGLAYAAVTGITLYGSSRVHRRASARARAMLDRIAGILLTAIAVTLLASGGTRLVVETFDALQR